MKILSPLVGTALLLFFACACTTNRETTQSGSNYFPEDITETRESKKSDEFKPVSVAESRELNKYIKSPAFQVGGIIKTETTDDKRAVCDFIWQNWTAKKYAFASIRFQGIDAWSTFYFFIEENKAGRWVVNTKILRNHSM